MESGGPEWLRVGGEGTDGLISSVFRWDAALSDQKAPEGKEHQCSGKCRYKVYKATGADEEVENLQSSSVAGEM